VRLADELPPL